MNVYDKIRQIQNENLVCFEAVQIIHLHNGEREVFYAAFVPAAMLAPISQRWNPRLVL